MLGFFEALQAASQFVFFEIFLLAYEYKCSINPRQYSRLKRSHTKQSCAHEIIHLNNMHGTEHTTEFV